MSADELMGWLLVVLFHGAWMALYLDHVIQRRRVERANREWLDRVTRAYREDTCGRESEKEAA